MRIKIVKKQAFRSKPFVNVPDDMLRITLDVSKYDWRQARRTLEKAGFTLLTAEDSQNESI